MYRRNSKWRDEILLLSKIADIQPQATYFVYIHGFKCKYNFFYRTISSMQNHMKIIEDVLRNHFIPAIIGESSISEHLRQLIALPTTYRNGSNNPLSQHRGRIKCIKVAYPTKEESLRLKTTSRREGPKLKIQYVQISNKSK